MRGATPSNIIWSTTSEISIHAPHARSDKDIVYEVRGVDSISIHAPHARSDCRVRGVLKEAGTISIHAPHARSDEEAICVPIKHIFQSTLLMRGATLVICITIDGIPYFNPRSSCEERQHTVDEIMVLDIISIHAPHARSDEQLFSGRGALYISIHAPHARSDDKGDKLRRQFDISIHAPHARSDLKAQHLVYRTKISIHAPHARSDSSLVSQTNTGLHFNPRSSCEERHRRYRFWSFSSYFNPRSSCEERHYLHHH